MIDTTSAALSLALVACAPAQGGAVDRDAPAELGRVAWTHGLTAGLERARELERPVCLLFQEIPGCATCVRFGNEPLSHPLLVEALEELFVPVLVYNNRGGRDAAALERFGEPSWNNPVVRWVDAQGEDLIPRRDRVWSTGGIAQRAVLALEAAGSEAPLWLRLVVEEEEQRGVATACFAMPCYWSGEALFGGIEGVVGTRAGWLGGHEVVQVRYRPGELAWPTLVRRAEAGGCAVRVFVPDGEDSDQRLAQAREVVGDRASRAPGQPRAAKASDQTYYLGRSPLAALELTPLQATRVNADLHSGGDWKRWLSPRGLRRAEQLLAKE